MGKKPLPKEVAEAIADDKTMDRLFQEFIKDAFDDGNEDANG